MPLFSDVVVIYFSSIVVFKEKIILQIFLTMITNQNCSTKVGEGLHEQIRKKYTIFQPYSMAK